MRRLFPLLFLLGCGDDPVEPPPPFVVELSWTRESAAIVNDRWRCDYTMTATASGGASGEFATWDSGEHRWLYTDGTASYPRSMQGTELVDYWGSDRIRTGETLSVKRWTQANVEHSISTVFRYRLASGELKSVDTVMWCGP